MPETGLDHSRSPVQGHRFCLGWQQANLTSPAAGQCVHALIMQQPGGGPGFWQAQHSCGQDHVLIS